MSTRVEGFGQHWATKKKSLVCPLAPIFELVLSVTGPCTFSPRENSYEALIISSKGLPRGNVNSPRRILVTA